MNDVSWKRILEQADSRQPFDPEPEAPRTAARAHAPERSPQQNVDWSNLEAELARTKHRDEPAATGSRARAMRQQRRPSPGQHATQLKMRMAHVSPNDAPHSQPQQHSDGKPSGARNLIAITLSVAVVGYAGYQLSERMPQTGADSEVLTAQHANNAAYADAGSALTAEPIFRASGNRLDLRPSLAAQSDSSAERLAAAKATSATGSLNTANLAAVLPPQQDGALEDGENEALILDRGRDILERGHVSGARLIFEYLADRGSALGAFALAQTYDVKYISKHNLPAESADETMASKWYQQAADMTDTAKAEAQ
jgi:hypothetical protein